MSKIEINIGRGNDGIYLNLFCGDYCWRLYNVRVNKDTMKIWYALSDELDWVQNDRVKLYLFIKRANGLSNEQAFNMVFSRSCLSDREYLLYNAGGMNE